MLYLLSSVAVLLGVSNADTYLHMPKGSNDRLNEQAAARNNENRLFNSQNNNRGGYNVGDMDSEEGFTDTDYMATATEMYDFRFLHNDNPLKKQYEMLYFEQSLISVTWTNQHGAGSAKENTEMILQFICDTLPRGTATTGGTYGPDGSLSGYSNGAVTAQMAATMRQHGLRVELYNGGNTNTPEKPNNFDAASITNAYDTNNGAQRGRRESEEYYALCNARSRNKGLFTADQQLQGSTQIYTRQNPGGTRYGLECQEERDYYPWWNPSPFHDIAIITADVQWCKDKVAPESQNVKQKYQCIVSGVTPSTAITTWLPTATAVQNNLNETTCTANAGYSWSGFSWNAAEPECVDSFYSRDNHLGNVDGTKRGGRMASYDWWLPSVEELNTQHYCHKYTYNVDDSADSTIDTSVSMECVRMMFRLRYNMSTMNFDPYNTDYRMNKDTNKGVIPPIEQNPTVDVGAFAQGLRLAINTAQTGRTFQDNTHTFLVCKRPSAAAWKDTTLINVNVRGKRGNIVQTFPAIEYDFEPQIAFVTPGQCLHFQWEGSNTHNNGNPGGDGQTGDAGEGRGGSDRSNLVQTLAMDDSYPLAYDKASSSFFDYVTCYHPLFPAAQVSSQDCQLTLGSAGFYRNVNDAKTQSNTDDKVMDYLLNNVSAAFRQGIVVCVNQDGVLANENDTKEFSFISTRNNNFSNRSQKWKVIITANPEDDTLW